MKVTVGIMTYNRPELLKEAVLSVLKQSFENFELIISNDYIQTPVTLDSLELIDDSRIKIINQVNNLGEVKNMNYLLSVAQGEWFVWLADDDLMHPDFLMLAYNVIANKKSKLVAVYSNYIAENSPVGYPNTLTDGKFFSYNPLEFLIKYTSKNISLIGCYGLMHTNTLRRIGGLPRLGNSFGPYSDNLIPVKLAQFGNIGWIDETLIFLRTHPDSLSCRSSEFSAFTSAEYEFLEILRDVCHRQGLTDYSDKIISNMVKWFAADELAVIQRDPLVNNYRAFKKFFFYQLEVNLPRLSTKYKIQHGLFVFRIFFEYLFLAVRGKLRSI